MKNLRIRIATAVVLVCGVSGIAQQTTNVSEKFNSWVAFGRAVCTRPCLGWRLHGNQSALRQGMRRQG